MSYLTRAKECIRQVARFDAALPSNAQLAELGQASLYHPTARPIWDTLLTQNSLVINPANPTVLDDIGSGDPFVPAPAGTKNNLLAALFMRLTRKQWIDWVRAYRLLTALAPAEPLAQAEATVLSTATTDAQAIVGADTNDPDN